MEATLLFHDVLSNPRARPSDDFSIETYGDDWRSRKFPTT